MRKILIILLTLTVITVFGQKNKKVELNWKINSDETLSYQTIMSEIDTTVIQFNTKVLSSTLLNSPNEDINKSQDLFKKLNEHFNNIDFVVNLSTANNGIVDIVMGNKPKETNTEIKTDTLDETETIFIKMMKEMSKGVMLRGSVYETGGIHSFWVKTNQKNLISLFFELPQKPVQVGDSWELDINLISNNHNFICDSSYKLNKVTLIDIKTVKNEKIAVLKYEIAEFVNGTFAAPLIKPTKTLMKLTYQGISEFSISKGRWVSYDGIMEIKTTGIMNSNVKKKFALIR